MTDIADWFAPFEPESYYDREPPEPPPTAEDIVRWQDEEATDAYHGYQAAVGDLPAGTEWHPTPAFLHVDVATRTVRWVPVPDRTAASS